MACSRLPWGRGPASAAVLTLPRLWTRVRACAANKKTTRAARTDHSTSPPFFVLPPSHRRPRRPRRHDHLWRRVGPGVGVRGVPARGEQGNGQKKGVGRGKGHAKHLEVSLSLFFYSFPFSVGDHLPAPPGRRHRPAPVMEIGECARCASERVWWEGGKGREHVRAAREKKGAEVFCCTPGRLSFLHFLSQPPRSGRARRAHARSHTPGHTHTGRRQGRGDARTPPTHTLTSLSLSPSLPLPSHAKKNVHPLSPGQPPSPPPPFFPL